MGSLQLAGRNAAVNVIVTGSDEYRVFGYVKNVNDV